ANSMLGEAEISYWLGKAWWGKGIATQAVRLFTALSFRELELDSIFAWAYQSNAASLRVLEKAGFTATDEYMPQDQKQIPRPIMRVYRDQFISGLT
ncbi:MAG: GNAT family N-acetyltransferase, partial [Gammaproteobacteria bacterium]|nr:GNAT family N-acetyltransferase [Gammaproteobacteria bacterium]NNM10686.1 GNAT family N-acetyltransferase [Pseudomonadales bacterium]